MLLIRGQWMYLRVEFKITTIEWSLECYLYRGIYSVHLTVLTYHFD